MIATTIEQSRRLLACGVSPDTADMYLEKSRLPEAGDFYLHTVLIGINRADWFSARMNKDIIPAWSLSALLELLPKKIFDEDIRYKGQLCLWRPFGYEFRYHSELFSKVPFTTIQKDPISACVEAIVWLTANGYKLNTPAATCKDE